MPGEPPPPGWPSNGLPPMTALGQPPGSVASLSPSGESNPASDKPSKKKRKRCGECPGCVRKDNCGDCGPCKSVRSHQICKMRKCDQLKTKKERAREALQMASTKGDMLSFTDSVPPPPGAPPVAQQQPPSSSRPHQQQARVSPPYGSPYGSGLAPTYNGHSGPPGHHHNNGSGPPPGHHVGHGHGHTNGSLDNHHQHHRRHGHPPLPPSLSASQAPSSQAMPPAHHGQSLATSRPVGTS
ncbi:DNA N6-methyl adenine demethylase [Halotydeus destructor]|nr:DNA N6-methyl adenine demethylase [Halotydeus destructor]